MELTMSRPLLVYWRLNSKLIKRNGKMPREGLKVENVQNWATLLSKASPALSRQTKIATFFLVVTLERKNTNYYRVSQKVRVYGNHTVS